MSDSQSYFTPPSHSFDSSNDTSTASNIRPLLNKGVRRPRLSEKMVKNLVARRYGSLHDFSQV